MLKSLTLLFERDLKRLISEIDKYELETDLWKVSEGINNSAGNLALHIVGNLNHFVGHILGGTDYIRNRNGEFNDQNIPKSEILDQIIRLKNILTTTLSNLPEKKLSEFYPIEVFGEPMTNEYFLIHLQGHLNYHLGQINYHRRILT